MKTRCCEYTEFSRYYPRTGYFARTDGIVSTKSEASVATCVTAFRHIRGQQSLIHCVQVYHKFYRDGDRQMLDNYSIATFKEALEIFKGLYTCNLERSIFVFFGSIRVYHSLDIITLTRVNTRCTILFGVRF